MSGHTRIFFVLLFVLVVCLSTNGVYAFGAGNIPSFAFLEGKAFRHGDIEDALAELIKKSGGMLALGGLLKGSGTKFNGLDVKRVYFGNWLRDYSQAVDIASLKKVDLQTIINLCMALGFLAHGYATHEFEVTEQRLAVYLPTEHIDNPKGYGAGEDARQYHPKLRGPIDPRELEIDPRTGMKNYIANENGTWDTSKALVRRTLEECVHRGRLHRSNGQKQDLYEAYRLLGQLMHTLEDFPAHSNFCELALVSMGHTDVFLHVGDHVRINAPSGKSVAPLVTGTFGSSDFIHSLLGEATDHISEASVSDLNKSLAKARSVSSAPGAQDNLRTLLFQMPGMGGGEMEREMEGVERIRAGPSHGGKTPEQMSPQELHAVLWQVLTFRDSVVKKIEKTIERIPGLQSLVEKLMDSISVFIFTTLEPFLKPILKTATTALGAASSEVIDNNDQYEVFNDPRASDPTHSFLSKDHFNLILNEPAGHVAKIIVIFTATAVVQAWDDSKIDVRAMSEEIMQCLFHPDFHNPQSKVQREMMQYMRSWVDTLGNRRHDVISRLSKDAVRNHRNVRLQSEGGEAQNYQGAHQAGLNAQHQLGQHVQAIPGVHQATGAYHQAQGMFNQAQDLMGGARQASGPGRSGIGFPRSPGERGTFSPPPGPPQGGTSSSYAPPSGPPPPPGSQGNPAPYAPPSGPPGYDSRPPPMPGRQESIPYHRPGYMPHYSSPAPDFPQVATMSGPPGSMPPPGFPNSSPYGPPSGPPPMPGSPPGFPGGAPPPPGFPQQQSGYLPPSGPPPPTQFPQGPPARRYPQDPGYPPPQGW